MICPTCHSNLLHHHTLENNEIPPMSNGSRIIDPRCSVCRAPIRWAEHSGAPMGGQTALLITGTAGAGKSALGQLIERRHGCVFVDGDAIQKRVKYFARIDPALSTNCHEATLEAAAALLALQYDIVVGYVITHDDLPRYLRSIQACGGEPVFRVLVPERRACVERDIARECWTAGARWIDQWHDEMQSYRSTHPALCVDSSNETLEQTYAEHFAQLFNRPNTTRPHQRR